MTPHVFEPDFSMSQEGDHLHRALTKGADIEMTSAYEARFAVGSRLANVRIESDQSLRVWIKPDRAISSVAALTLNHSLPGNLRFAAASGGKVLMADTRIDGELHLPRSLAEIRRGLAMALESCPQPPRRRKQHALQQEQVAEAMGGCGWGQDMLVHLDHGWEVRRPVCGHMSAVVISIDEEGLNVRQTVLPDRIPESTSVVVARQALRFNLRLRHARLAIASDGLVAQARLHPGLVQPRWIVAATSAVAVAARQLQVVLQVLAEQEEVASLYRAIFP